MQQHARMVTVACIINALPQFPVQFPTQFLSCPRLQPAGSPVFQCSLEALTSTCDFETCIASFELTACDCRLAVGCTCLLPLQHHMPAPATSKHSPRLRQQQLGCSNLTPDASLQPAHRLSCCKQTCLLMVGAICIHFA